MKKKEEKVSKNLKRLEQIKKDSEKMNHPECKGDEFFLTNYFFYFDYQGIGWKTKRAGNVAYSLKGEQLFDGVPVFVKKSEVIEYFTNEH